MGGTFVICDFEKAKCFYDSNQNKSDIILSFTTMPDRLHSKTFIKALCCMLNQTHKLTEIRLNIPYVAKRTGKKYHIPQWLLNCKQITIIRCEEDYGPATKYIPTLQHFETINPDQKILIYDDDSFMPVDLVENFERLSFRYPNYCFTSEARRIKHNKNINKFDIKTVFSNTHLFSKLHSCFIGQESFHVTTKQPIIFGDVAYGYTGYLITPKMVNLIELMDFKNLPEAAVFVDDVTISGNLLKNNTPIAVGYGLSVGKVSFRSILETGWSKLTKKPQGEALTTTANFTSSNDDKMHEFYKNQWGKFSN